MLQQQRVGGSRVIENHCEDNLPTIYFDLKVLTVVSSVHHSSF